MLSLSMRGIGISVKEDINIMGDIKFTIITVAYNASDCIAKTIESVLNQSETPYEYIIVDGQSTDETVGIAQSYEKDFSDKDIIFRIYSEKDTGIYNAMNKGINMANGDYISFINAGDWYENNAIKTISDVCIKNIEMVYGSINYYTRDGRKIIKKSRKDKWIISTRNWNHPSMFMKTSVYKEKHLDEQYKVYADFDLFLKVRNERISFAVVDKVITNFVADGVSTKCKLKDVLIRASEKYNVYRNNGYGFIYFFEAYGWEIIKMIFLRLNS